MKKTMTYEQAKERSFKFPLLALGIEARDSGMEYEEFSHENIRKIRAEELARHIFYKEKAKQRWPESYITQLSKKLRLLKPFLRFCKSFYREGEKDLFFTCEDVITPLQVKGVRFNRLRDRWFTTCDSKCVIEEVKGGLDDSPKTVFIGIRDIEHENLIRIYIWRA